MTRSECWDQHVGMDKLGGCDNCKNWMNECIWQWDKKRLPKPIFIATKEDLERRQGEAT